MANPQEADGRSYLAKLSPWSRSPSIAPSKGTAGEPTESGLLQQQNGADHVVNHRHRLSLRKYPRDCPHLRPQWFHAVDIPIRKPHLTFKKVKEEKPPGQPKKYAAFSTRDSKAIEIAFQKLSEQEEEAERTQAQSSDLGHARAGGRQGKKEAKIPVNEDYLFDVDVEARELAPAYWLGPVYDVRRGTWFYQEGSEQKPCDENLAAQLEEGYLKVKAWRLPSAQKPEPQPRSPSRPRMRPKSWAPGEDEESTAPPPVSQKGSSADLRKKAELQAAQAGQAVEISDKEQVQSTYRLFGQHMNSVVTYQDGKTAWLMTDDAWSRINSTVRRGFGGVGHFAGVRLTRGWTNPTAKKAEKDAPPTNVKDKPYLANDEEPSEGENVEESRAERATSSETKRQTLQRQMSALLEDPTHGDDPARLEEEARRRDEREIEDDYRNTEDDDQGRDIEHLILVTHGIGQRLTHRVESVNFVHDVNTFRKTIKAVYADSPDLRALNQELEGSDSVNSRVQVLPICWRQKLDFPNQGLRHNRKEHDLGDSEIDEEDYPSLEDITVDGVPFARDMITDLALDILLYDSPAYKDHISMIVLNELNRIYHLFMERNPNFNGKISLVGHSLGSAIMFDILCRQDQQPASRRKGVDKMNLDFPVEDFYALGSPIGLFQMLNGRTIVARTPPGGRHRARSSLGAMEDPMLGSATKKKASKDSEPADVPGENPLARPKCAQIFNIFHPTDPISYRIEPLISPAMAQLKPQPLPYTKRGIFGAPSTQGLTGIGARVGQSVSSMWTSMASSLLTRGLGYGSEPTKAAADLKATSKSSGPLSRSAPGISSNSASAGTNVAAGIIPTAPLPAEGTEIMKIGEDKISRVAADAQAASESKEHPPTLIDNELTTLYSNFEKRRESAQSDAETRDVGAGAVKGIPEWADAEERGKKLRKEEEKVRRLNSNGRVDYAIQEGAFDINFIAAIASHLSYWSDEDVSHFVISQLLSRHRIVRQRADSAPNQGKPK
ncbi:uncharacterized protein MYCFIDRAFT_155646 [Pseudocercospora fijiensis CIRAD86]|uniref:DDHD domain-containing protein n=1 Tax=Pseudocercospora fijiensis (strain CIRAD86) TaxID=383855 RepID=M2YUR5_PSEFD|nr:uncharacterized protein MYCFIDRAFT_155646 [Pseudocercospora fijiensis CIRAD86]EME81485.1 hypothetical protein MYCFIDRAFT_155646 [Pseudocercospora fijiensis CIRAD86]